MATLEHRGKTYQSVEITKSVDVLTSEQLGALEQIVERGACVRNAYLATKQEEQQGAVCVEGFIKYNSHRSSGSYTEVVGHCWSRIGEKHFDVTIDLVWSKCPEQFGDVEYYVCAEHACSEYAANRSNGDMTAQSNAFDLAKEILGDMRLEYDKREAEKQSKSPEPKAGSRGDYGMENEMKSDC